MFSKLFPPAAAWCALVSIAWGNEFGPGNPPAGGGRLVAQPARVELREGETEHGLLLTQLDPAGENPVDVTGRARFSSSAPEIIAKPTP